MTKRLERMLGRKRRLEDAIIHEYVFCAKHQRNLTLYEMAIHRCYAGNHNKGYCKYVRINYGGRENEQ
jgi:hypothetical protein